jgi:opacity protein-like surface antigen
MKRFLLVFVILIVISTSVFAAKPIKGVGVGLNTGIPFQIGPTAEYNFGPAYAAISLGYLRYIGTNLFMLEFEGGYNFDKPFVNNDWGVDLYLSVGGNFNLFFTKGFTMFGVGVPVTWSYTLPKTPIKFYVKAEPKVIFGSGFSDLMFIGSAGAKYVFEL